MNDLYRFQKKIPGIFIDEIHIQGNFSMPKRHVHETTELLFVLESERDFFIGHEFYHLAPGMALLVEPNQPHKGCMITEEGTYHRLLLQIDSRMLDKYFSLPEFSDIKNFGAKYSGMAAFSSEDWKQV